MTMRRFLVPLLLFALAPMADAQDRRHGASGTLAAEPEVKAGREILAEPRGGPYYRLLRGVRKPSLGQEEFLRKLSSELVPAWPALQGAQGLTGCIQAVPPAGVSTGLPDAVSLVAYESERTYRKARNGPQSARLHELQWQVFDQEKTGAGPSRPFRGKLRPEEAVEIVSLPGIDWQAGQTMVFVGARKASLPRVKFLPELTKHVVKVRDQISPLGLDGYILCGTYDYEVAFMHFPTAAACQAALSNPKAKELLAEAGQIFDIAMFAPAAPFTGTLAPGQAVSASTIPLLPEEKPRKRGRR